MAPRKQSKGTCAYCGKELAKSGVSKHLAICPKRQAAIAKAEQGKKTSEILYHLRIEDAYRKDFWLDLEMRGSKTLEDLDAYLRAIWLECCGHLSEFLGKGSMARKIGKQRKISEVLQPGDHLTHIYDFGTSSQTEIKVTGVREGKPTTSHAIALIARNNMPEDKCIECGDRATHLCMECLIEDDTWGALCEKHAEEHPHQNYDDPIPLVNSPRLGLCGYVGPADPPY